MISMCVRLVMAAEEVHAFSFKIKRKDLVSINSSPKGSEREGIKQKRKGRGK